MKSSYYKLSDIPDEIKNHPGVRIINPINITALTKLDVNLRVNGNLVYRAVDELSYIIMSAGTRYSNELLKLLIKHDWPNVVSRMTTYGTKNVCKVVFYNKVPIAGYECPDCSLRPRIRFNPELPSSFEIKENHKLDRHNTFVYGYNKRDSIVLMNKNDIGHVRLAKQYKLKRLLELGDEK